MRYDIIIIGETGLAHREAVRAARQNHLVAVVRTVPLLDCVFQYPLENWDWSSYPTWKCMKSQFDSAEAKFSSDYAREGIELFEGQPVRIEDESIVLKTRSGRTVDLHSNRIQYGEPARNEIPDWLRMEVPHVQTLSEVSRLTMLPESVFIEGNSLAALRFAVLCARLNRTVTICSAGWNAPQFGVELTELESEATDRGILRLDQQELHSVCETSSGEFDIWLLNGDVHRAGLYVFGAERAVEGVQTLAVSS